MGLVRSDRAGLGLGRRRGFGWRNACALERCPFPEPPPGLNWEALADIGQGETGKR